MTVTCLTKLAMLIALAVLLLIRNHRVLQRYRYVAMFIGIVLLLMPPATW